VRRQYYCLQRLDVAVPDKKNEQAIMTIAQRLTEAEYEQFVFANPDHKWELVEGQLREKPGMSWEHDDIVSLLAHLLQLQLDRSEFRVRIDSRIRRPPGNIFVPDLLVVPTRFGEEFRGRPGVLVIFGQPLPLVVEVWSQSTGDHDVAAKIPEYQRRGDLEIWRLHPYERTVTSWIRLTDGTYHETVYHEGLVRPTALPDATIDLAELFAD
jgi:Uma2 family endonuclease